MSEPPFTLRIHVIGGQTIDLPCKSFEIVPVNTDEDLNNSPLRLDYTPVDGWTDTLGFLDMRAVTAIEVHRSAEMVAQAEDE